MSTPNNGYTCSPFFLSSALTSLVFGEINSNNTLKNAGSNMEFKRELCKIKEQFEDEKFVKELFNKRNSIEKGRAYQLKESKNSFETQKQTVEFGFFQRNCWPLTLDIQTVWSKLSEDKKVVPMLVILTKPNKKAVNIGNDYVNLCHALKNSTDNLGAIDTPLIPWNEKVVFTGGVSQSMNIHHIMQGLPAVIISPQLIHNTLNFNVSMWSFQRGLGSFISKTLLSLPYDDKEYSTLSNKIKQAQFLIAGVVRDAYMLMEYRKPATLPTTIKDEVATYPQDFKEFLSEQYTDIWNQINSSGFISLCTDEELQQLQKSVSPINELIKIQ
jgi:hypothetical protein